MRKILQTFGVVFSTMIFSQITTEVRNDAGLQGDQGAKSGFFETSNPINYPSGALGWWHLLDIRHSNTSNNYAMQFAGSFFDQNLYFRKTMNNPAQSWQRILTTDSDGKLAIGGGTTIDKLAISGSHEGSTILLQADNTGNPNAYLTLWASEPNASYTGVGIGNNIRNFYNGVSFQRINTQRGASYIRLLENAVQVNLVPENGTGKEIMYLGADGASVSGSVNASNGHLYTAKSTNEGGALIIANPSKTGAQFSTWNIYNMTGPYTNSLQFWNYSADGTQSNPRLKISDDGNMALYGKFEAKEVKVTTTPTADFVFAENYNLPKLEEVEKHIKEKKHLPEIASAAEMEKEGVNVGDFQIQLLQKIEELTLYSIEQNKKINLLMEENIRQSKAIEQLEKK